MDLTRAEIRALKLLWERLENDKTDFFTDVFANFASSQPDLPAADKKDFDELISGCITEIDNVDPFLHAFVRENKQFCQLLELYADVMGTVLVTTVKQWLGRVGANKEVEQGWVKMFCHAVNVAVADDQLEVSLTYSEEAPLNVRKSTLVSSEDQLTVQLDANEKYRGFRRSVNEQKGAPLQVKIPQLPLFQKLLSSLSLRLSSSSSSVSSRSFDPRRRHVASSNPNLTDYELDIETSSVLTDSLRQTLNSPSLAQRRQVPLLVRKLQETRSVSSYSTDVDTDTDLDDVPLTFDPRRRKAPVASPSPVDAATFGLRGLAPIVEQEQDFGDVTSKYSDDGSHKLSVDEVSLGALTLSLRRSLASSTNDAMLLPLPDLKAAPQTHYRTPLNTSSISYMKQLPARPYQAQRFGKLTLSLLSDYSSQASGRALMGFMRSSFVLKKEMEEMGLSDSEQLAPPRSHRRHPLISSANSLVYRSPVAARSEVTMRPPRAGRTGGRSRMLDVYEALIYSGSKLMLTVNVDQRPPVAPSQYQYKTMQVVAPLAPEKKGFRARIKLIFGSKAPVDQAVPEVVVPAAPVAPEPRLQRRPSMPGSRRPSVSQAPLPALALTASFGTSYAAFTQQARTQRPYKNRNYSVADVALVHLNDLTTSGFSFFSRRSTRHPKRGNKYQVHSVPYSIFARGVPQHT